METNADFLFCKEMFEKFGERRLIGRGEYFVRSGEVMEYAGWMVSGGFRYSVTSSDGNNRVVIGFSIDDSILMDYESVMHSTKTCTDIIDLDDSEVIVIPARIMRERLNGDCIIRRHCLLPQYFAPSASEKFIKRDTNKTNKLKPKNEETYHPLSFHRLPFYGKLPQ